MGGLNPNDHVSQFNETKYHTRGIIWIEKDDNKPPESPLMRQETIKILPGTRRYSLSHGNKDDSNLHEIISFLFIEMLQIEGWQFGIFIVCNICQFKNTWFNILFVIFWLSMVPFVSFSTIINCLCLKIFWLFCNVFFVSFVLSKVNLYIRNDACVSSYHAWKRQKTAGFSWIPL